MNRAFSACPMGHQIRGAMPQRSPRRIRPVADLQLKTAPLALNRAKVKKLVRTTHYFL